MSKIDEFLKDEKVEWKKLGEVCEIVTDYVAAGSFKSIAENVNYLNEPDYAQLVRTKDIKSNFNNIDSFIYVNKRAFDYLYRVNLDKECLILPNIGNCGEIYHILPDKLPYKNNVLGPNAIFIRSKNSNMKFLYYLFQERYFQGELYKITSKTGQGKFNKTDLKQIYIPMPSIETQEKIVRTLDKFTNYVTELQSELQSRTKQYEYYRDMLLSEEYLNKISSKVDVLESKDYEVKFTTLGEIAQINRGASPRPITKYITDDTEGISWIKIGDIGTNSKYVTKTAQKITIEGAKKSRILKKGDFIMSNSMSYGRPYILDIDGAIHDGWASISEFHNTLDSDFLYYYLTSSKVQNYWKGKINSSSVSNLNSEIIRSLPIPVIDKELQKIVAKILDKFQSLLADTKGLLPQEIEQRQKQYEYYREKLLTFDENSVKRERERAYLSNSYLNSLKEAGEIVEVSVFGVKLKRLEDIAELYDGTHQTPKYVNTGVPFVSVQDIKNIYGTDKYITIEEYNKFKVKPRKNDVFMTRIGDIGTCAIVKNDEDLAYYVTLALIRPSNDIVLSKFLKYLIESNQGKKELSKRILHNATPIKINLGEIGKLQFLIPSIQVQVHIVSILDKFDSIVNDISKGLPKEIELRQKQYEYYREKLLSFEK